MPRVKKTTVELDPKALVKKEKKERELAIDVYDTKGKIIETISLPKEIFGAKMNKQLIAQAIRVYLANKRRGTSSTKTRGEVAGSTRKIYRQKGTGRARHGAIRAPIFVHGGIAFGPKPRDYSLRLPKNMKKAALSSALSAKLREGDIRVVAGLEKIEPKTKSMISVFERLRIIPKKKTLVVLPLHGDKISPVVKSSRNIEGVFLTEALLLNTYEVLDAATVIFMKDAIDVLQKRFHKEEHT